MSVRASDQVWRKAKAKGSELLLLLAIADCANDEGTQAFPSIATLALKTRLTQRQVINLVKALEAAGELSVVRPAVRRLGLANSYTLHVGELGEKFSPENFSREKSLGLGEAGFTTTVLLQRTGHHSDIAAARALWDGARERLAKRMTKANFDTWIEGTVAQGFRGQELVVSGPAPQVEALRTRFAPLIRQALPDTVVRFEAG